ncbi:TPA: GIY-YIG nuclease family protein [Escherichia coli]
MMNDVRKACDIPFNFIRTKNGKAPSHPIDMETRIVTRIENEGLPLIYHGFKGEYKSINSRIVLECESCARIRDITAKQFLHNPTVCPCHRSKYDNKYKNGQPVLYVMRCGDVGKVGVSHNVLRRKHKLRYQNKMKFDIIEAFEFQDEKDAYAAELFIKKNLVKGDFDIKEGATETFVYNEKMVRNIANVASIF